MEHQKIREMLSPKEMMQRFKVCRRTLDNMEKTGKIPKRVHLSQRTVRWWRDEVESYGAVA